MLQDGHADAEGEGGVAQQQSVPQVEDLVQWKHVCMRHNTKQEGFLFDKYGQYFNSRTAQNQNTRNKSNVSAVEKRGSFFEI